MNTIKFYNIKEKWGEFSNFYPSPIIINGITGATFEHYYQAAKFIGVSLEYSKLILKQNTPNKAKILASQKISGGYKWRTDLNVFIKLYLDQGIRIRNDWENVKDNIMRKIVYIKFSNQKLKNVLLSTGGYAISEHTTRDFYWGDGGNGNGKNMLGKILVETRSLLSGNYPKAPTNTSNWIIPDILLASDYPSKHDEDFKIYCNTGIDTFINLMTREDINNSTDNYECKPYDYDNQRKMISNKNGITLCWCPIPDCKVTDDTKVLKLVKMIISWLGLGKKILIHCLGGKGRTGTILGIVLAYMYNISYDKVLITLAESFKTRITKGKCPRMPQTRIQRAQIKRIISLYSSEI